MGGTASWAMCWAKDSSVRAASACAAGRNCTTASGRSCLAGRSLSSQALIRGKTVLVAEAGRSGVVAPSDITALVEGSLNVLGQLQMLQRQVHRVANPPRAHTTGSRRQTVGFFLHPNYDTQVTCLPTCADADHPPRYAPILAGEHMSATTRRQGGRRSQAPSYACPH